MKRYLLIPAILIIALLTACGSGPVNLGSAPSAMTPSTPESYTVVPQFEIGNTPEVVFVTQNPDFSGHQPIGTLTAQHSFTPPTPVVGNSTIFLGGERPSTIFVTVDGNGYGCLNEKCQYEQTLGEDLPEAVMYALHFSTRENENTISFIGGNPVQIWIDNGGIITCTKPCQGEFEVMQSYRYDLGLISLAEAGQNVAADAIKFWREAADNGNACIPSGKAIGPLSYCFRSLATPTP